MTFFKQAGAIFWKDVLTEFRTKDALTSMLLFGLLVILMFHFAFDKPIACRRTATDPDCFG